MFEYIVGVRAESEAHVRRVIEQAGLVVFMEPVSGLSCFAPLLEWRAQSAPQAVRAIVQEALRPGPEEDETRQVG